MQVFELMTSDVLTVRDDAPVSQAAAEMRLAHVRHLPVVTSAGALVGMLASLDVALSKLSARPDSLVAEVMSTALVTVREDADAAEAAQLMRERKVSALPVLRDGKLVGLITASDFLEIAERALRGKPLRLAR